MEGCHASASSNDAIHIIYMCMNAISGSLSILGSFIIIFVILRGGQTKLSRLQNRLLLGSSSIDMLYSLALGLSFIPSPQLDDCSLGKGNASSCTAQGFFLTLGLAVPGYTAMLSMYYLVTVVYNKTEEMISQKFELFMHAYAVLPALICAIIGASKSYFFNQVGQCWIEDPCLSSKECDGWDAFGKGGWLVLASGIWVGINSLVCSLCMITIYCKINGRAKAMRRYLFAQASAPPSRMEIAAKESAKQGILYISAFLFTYSWSGISLLLQSIDRDRPSPTLYILTAVFLPLQGFWNFLTYIRPRFVKLQQEDESLSFVATLKMIIFAKDHTEAMRQQICQRRQQRRRSIRFDLIIKDTTGAGIDIESSDDNNDAPLEVLNQAEVDRVIEVVDSLKNCDKANIYV